MPKLSNPDNQFAAVSALRVHAGSLGSLGFLRLAELEDSSRIFERFLFVRLQFYVIFRENVDKLGNFWLLAGDRAFRDCKGLFYFDKIPGRNENKQQECAEKNRAIASFFYLFKLF